MYYIGIDVGGTSIKSCLADGEGKILAKASRHTRGSDRLVGDVYSLCGELISAAGLLEDDIKAVGMGIPGTVDATTGTVKYSNNLEMENLSIVSEFRGLFDVPTYIANDADAAALGEFCFGSCRGMKNMVFITLGTGVGTGIILDGRLLHGSEGGHMVIEVGGERCTCGGRGCLECYASATALKRMTKKQVEKDPSGRLAAAVKAGGISAKTAFDCAKAGDEASAKLVDEYLSYVSVGIVGLANIFNPDCVLIGGGISNESAEYFKTVENKVKASLFGSAYRKPLTVAPSSLKNDAGVLGAVALAMSSPK